MRLGATALLLLSLPGLLLAPAGLRLLRLPPALVLPADASLLVAGLSGAGLLAAAPFPLPLGLEARLLPLALRRVGCLLLQRIVIGVQRVAQTLEEHVPIVRPVLGLYAVELPVPRLDPFLLAARLGLSSLAFPARLGFPSFRFRAFALATRLSFALGPATLRLGALRRPARFRLAPPEVRQGVIEALRLRAADGARITRVPGSAGRGRILLVFRDIRNGRRRRGPRVGCAGAACENVRPGVRRGARAPGVRSRGGAPRIRRTARRGVRSHRGPRGKSRAQIRFRQRVGAEHVRAGRGRAQRGARAAEKVADSPFRGLQPLADPVEQGRSRYHVPGSFPDRVFGVVESRLRFVGIVGKGARQRAVQRARQAAHEILVQAVGRESGGPGADGVPQQTGAAGRRGEKHGSDGKERDRTVPAPGNRLSEHARFSLRKRPCPRLLQHRQ